MIVDRYFTQHLFLSSLLRDDDDDDDDITSDWF